MYSINKSKPYIAVNKIQTGFKIIIIKLYVKKINNSELFKLWIIVMIFIIHCIFIKFIYKKIFRS